MSEPTFSEGIVRNEANARLNHAMDDLEKAARNYRKAGLFALAIRIDNAGMAIAGIYKDELDDRWKAQKPDSRQVKE